MFRDQLETQVFIDCLRYDSTEFFSLYNYPAIEGKIWKRVLVQDYSLEIVTAPKKLQFQQGGAGCLPSVITEGICVTDSVLTSAQMLHASLAFFTVSS